MPKKRNITPDEAEEMPIINDFAQDAFDDETPPDIDEFLSEIGLEGKQYRCTLKQYPADDSGVPVFMPGSWKGSYPSIPELGSKFGPGRYLYIFSWRVPNPAGGTKAACKQTEVVLGDQWQEAHEEYLYQYSIRRKKKLENLKLQEEQRSILNGTQNNHNKGNGDGVSDLLEASNKLRQLGVPVGATGRGTDLMGTDGGGLLPMLFNMQQKSSEQMMLIMQNNQASMMQLFGMIMTKDNGGNSFQQAMKETISMVTNVIDLKQALNPEKATIVDKIFDFMQGVAPQIATILAQPRDKARQDPMVKLAQSRPEMEAIKTDQAAIDALSQKLDSEYGIKQANEILDVMGLQRSQALKHHLKTGGYDPEPHPPIEEADVINLGPDIGQGIQEESDEDELE